MSVNARAISEEKKGRSRHWSRHESRKKGDPTQLLPQEEKKEKEPSKSPLSDDAFQHYEVRKKGGKITSNRMPAQRKVQGPISSQEKKKGEASWIQVISASKNGEKRCPISKKKKKKRGVGGEITCVKANAAGNTRGGGR